jgi:beta-galactosidase
MSSKPDCEGVLGVCWYPEHWPEAWWAEDARQMRELGISYVRIGEFAWSRIEPEPGRFDWGWLDRAMDVLGRAGLNVVLGTPTATPPKWLVDAMPDMVPVDDQGRPRGFGSRRHYSFSHRGWFEASARIVEAVARRYGEHPALAGWQTDNEYGCHGTILSFDTAAQADFRDWLRRRYQDPAALNEAWGNVFWSMEAGAFDEVGLPNLTVTEANPAARLDFWRYSSEQVARYNRMQVEIIRAHSPGRFVTHNFMGLFHDFDHWAVGADLDFATWDSYPLGFVERFPFSEAERVRWAPTSHPDMAAFHHDLYRGVGCGRWWVMEQQPGPVNWAPWNPVPAPGMVRLWTWEALAHGAEVVSYFRWRQAPFAQEQMHAGLQRPDRQWSAGGLEAAQVGRELAGLDLPASRRAPVALVFDYEASWITRIQPQGADFNYTELTYRWYEAARRLGLDLDIVPAGVPLDGYAAALVPTLPYVSEAALAAFRRFDGVLLFGPRTGSKTRNFGIPDKLPPGPLQALLPLKVAQVASLRPGPSVEVQGEGVAGRATRWREWLETDLPVLAGSADGGPALVGDGRRFYLGCWPEADLLGAVLRRLLNLASLDLLDLPAAVRLRRRGDLAFAFNYGDTPWACPAPSRASFLLGDATVAPRDLACWRA